MEDSRDELQLDLFLPWDGIHPRHLTRGHKYLRLHEAARQQTLYETRKTKQAWKAFLLSEEKLKWQQRRDGSR